LRGRKSGGTLGKAPEEKIADFLRKKGHSAEELPKE